MTGPHEQASATVTEISRVRRHGRARSSGAARWGPWLFSLLVATGAILMVTINGSGGAAAQVPSVIQVGNQAGTQPGIAVTTIPAPPSSSSTTTIPVAQHLTTVVRPQATVTDHEDPGSGDNSSETNVGANAGATSTSNP